MMDSDEVEESPPAAVADYRRPGGRDLTAAEVAALLDVSLDAVRRLMASGRLRATKALRQLWFSRRCVNAYMAANRPILVDPLPDLDVREV